ncbi:MAG: hypothetical protein PWQ28_661 [Candidatus Woesearchaeota archaeon]|nr:hypothetical protein [Candidatus Woesearchaeota archaeon]
MSKNFNDISSLHENELRERLKEARIELIKLKGQAAMASSQKDVAKIKNLKKTISRINSLLKNKEDLERK